MQLTSQSETYKKENLKFVERSWKEKVWKTLVCALENLESFLYK